jgi:outer membrane protein TolC
MTITVTNISLVNISSVQAATTDNTGVTSTDNTSASTTKVSLENIRDIMTENNLDIKVLDNNLKIARQNYEDAKTAEGDAKTANTNANTANTNANTAYNNAVTANDGTATSKLTSLDAAQKSLATSVADLAKADADLTTDKNKLESAQSSYDKGVEDKVYAAQEEYLTYLSDLSTQKLNEDTVQSNEKEDQVYKLQYESGFISKNDYTDKLQKNTAVNDSNKSKDTEELDRTKLCNTLGLSPEANITFNTDITEDFQVISKINYDDDLKQMFDNNVDIKLANDNIDTLNNQIDGETNTTDSTDTIDNYNKDNAQISLKQKMSDAESSFKGQYNTLMESYNSIKSSYDKITQEQTEYQTTQTEYDYGFASKDQVDTAKLAFDKDSATFNSSKNTLYVNYLRYIQMKEGY